MQLVNSVRKHWLLILLLIIGLLWWRIVDAFMPPEFYFNPYMQPIDYWSIVINPEFQRIALTITLGITALTLLAILRFSKTTIIYRVLLILATLIMSGGSILRSLNLSLESGSNRTIKHIMSIDYQSKIYHLSISYYVTMDFPEYLPRYHVFKCDTLGHMCSQIYTKDIDYNSQAQLVVDADRLVLVTLDGQTQIIPAVNGSS